MPKRTPLSVVLLEWKEVFSIFLVAIIAFTALRSDVGKISDSLDNQGKSIVKIEGKLDKLIESGHKTEKSVGVLAERVKNHKEMHKLETKMKVESLLSPPNKQYLLSMIKDLSDTGALETSEKR
jgi:hypothetical protein